MTSVSSPVFKVMNGAGGTSRKRMIIVFSAALVTALGLALWLLTPRQPQVVDEGALAALDQRIAELAKRIEQLERLGRGVVQMSEALDRIDQRGTQLDEIFTRIEDQNRRSDKFIARVDALESAMIERLMDIHTRLGEAAKPTAAPRVETPAASPPAAAAQVAAAAPRLAPPEIKPQPRTHTVQAGDTLHSIARRYGLTVGALRRLNRLPANPALRSGQRLIVSKS
jgi:LysM repeat protein